jgi:hypothetical protein
MKRGGWENRWPDGCLSIRDLDPFLAYVASASICGSLTRRSAVKSSRHRVCSSMEALSYKAETIGDPLLGTCKKNEYSGVEQPAPLGMPSRKASFDCVLELSGKARNSLFTVAGRTATRPSTRSCRSSAAVRNLKREDPHARIQNNYGWRERVRRRAAFSERTSSIRPSTSASCTADCGWPNIRRSPPGFGRLLRRNRCERLRGIARSWCGCRSQLMSCMK